METLNCQGERGVLSLLPQTALETVNRKQLVMRTVDLEKAISEDHPARAIWAMVERLK